MPRADGVPYWRLSAFYFAYFATLGALLPYWGLYLKYLGFTPIQIGELIAIISATKIVAPNVWGWIADHTGDRMRIVRLACLASAVAFAGVLLDSTYVWLALVMALYSFFWNASLPQFEATTLTHLGTRPHRYSTIRLWGSIGFIATAAGLGPVLEAQGASVLPLVLLALFAAIFLTSLTVPERASGHLPLDQEPFRAVLARPAVGALLAVCFLIQVSHGPYYAFYTIYLEEYGYSRGLIGGLWALGVIAEIGVFLVVHGWMERYSSRTLLLVSVFLATVRWAVIGVGAAYLPLMAAAQLLHAATFGVYHAVAIHLIHKYFTGRHQGRGQALYSSLSFGAGGAVGAFYSGYSWSAGGPLLTFGIAAAVCVLALGVTLKWIKPN